MVHKSKSVLKIKSLTVYRTDAVMSYVGGAPPKGEKGNRGDVTELSRRSLQKLAFYAQNTPVKFVTITTLTYPGTFPRNGQEIKQHLNRFLAWMRAKWKGVNYLWFLEFQKRGAPHFHILTDVNMSAEKGSISLRWYKAVGSEDKRHLRAGTNTERIRLPDGAARYAAKYAAKREQKTVPVGFGGVGRFWGCSRGVKPIPIKEYDLRGMSGGELQGMLKGMGWGHSDAMAQPLKVLYNAGKLFI